MTSSSLALVPTTFDPKGPAPASKSQLAIAQLRRGPVPRGEPITVPRRGLYGWSALALLVVAVTVAVWRPWQASADLLASHASAGPRVVSIDHPSAATSTSVVLPATVRPWQTATLHARVSGYLAHWHHDLGDTVKAGELLAEIDTPELDQELAEGQALAREALAAVAQAKAERIEAEADSRVAQAQLVRVRAEVELAQAQFVRRTRLLETRTISQEEHETFRRDLAVRNADVATAESEVNRRRTNLKTRSAIIEVREASARSRRSSVDRLNELQTFKHIVAPFDGVVAQRKAEVGLLVTAGEQPLFLLEDTSRVRVQMNVPQTYAAQTVAGETARVSLPESSAQPVAATITRVSDSVEVASRTMLAEIELVNRDHRFQPGSYAQVTLQTRNSSDWTIPTNTVQMRVDGPHVALVDEHDEIVIRRVSLGRDLGARVVAVEGIEGNERLVVNPTDDLTRGLRVRVESSSAPNAQLAQH